MIFDSILPLFRWIRDKKYHFTKGLFETSYNFSLWSHKRPSDDKIIATIELETLKKYIIEIDCFIDIGAFIGFFSVYAKKINTKLDIYSFEPHPQNYKLLEKNYELNKLDKNNLFNLGLSDKKGYEKLYGFGQGASLLPNWGGISNFGIRIPLSTLDHYYDYFKEYKKGIFIKIDTEGSEYDILKISKNITRIESLTFARSNKLRGTINIPDGVTFIGASAFQQSSGFTRLNLPDSLEVIQNAAFFLCNSLGGDIFIPDKVTRIEQQTFYDCYPIRSLRLSPFTTYIGQQAFTNCVGLSGVLDIPNTITEIAYQAFRNCSSVTRINIRAATAPIIADAFLDMTSVNPAVIHVPVGAVGYAASYNGLTVVYDL